GHDDAVAVERGWLPTGAPALPDDPVFGCLAPDVVEAVVEGGRARLVTEAKERMWFIEPVRPLPRLVIAGAGHVGRAVARLGSLLDFSVTVIDDREEFANIANVPDADEIVAADIGEAIKAVEDSPDNYFVIVTRGHQKDAEALRAAIGRPAAYIGMIGSRRKIELMECEFLENGWATKDEWAAVHAPIGLDIGSRTVEEIAVSIAAELVKVRSARLGTVGP
ncbi:MAG TPA: XdhC family protein, partial [Candidatus Bathyarchaeia archaeon]|nr:XdhC family protein [Candidatus Bathyarchaeia archaeon]